MDAADAGEAALERLDGMTPEAAAERLDLADGDPPAIAYYLAALREAFEETGIVVGVREDGSAPSSAAADPAVERVRDDVMEDRISFLGGAGASAVAALGRVRGVLCPLDHPSASAAALRHSLLRCPCGGLEHPDRGPQGDDRGPLDRADQGAGGARTGVVADDPADRLDPWRD